MNYPDFYGGIWMSGNGGLEIAVLDLDDEKKKYFAEIIDLTDVTFVEAKYSYKAICLENESIAKRMLNPKTEAEKALTSVGIGKNILWMTFNCDSIDKAKEYAKSITSFDAQVETGTIFPAEDPGVTVSVEDPLEANVVDEG